MCGDGRTRPSAEFGSAAVYENAVVQCRCDMEFAPSARGDRNAGWLLLLVWRTKADQGQKNRHLARSTIAAGSRGTRSGPRTNVAASVPARVGLESSI